jgi:hypothetical protein
MAYMGKVKYYRKVVADSPEKKMADFMVSEGGHYNGDFNMAALAALDHSREYAEGSDKNDFWYRVYCRLEVLSLDLINIDKIESCRENG